MKKKFLPLFIIMSFHYTLFSQQKYEQEIRIKEKEVPAKAKTFVKKSAFKKKVKWYKEMRGNAVTIEAKTKHQKRKYSIEFNLDGNLEDVEIEISSKEIPDKTITSISKYFRNKYGRYKIEKIQIQYTGDSESVLKKVSKGSDSKEVILRYEIVIITRIDKKFQKFEYLFSEQGNFIKAQKIILKNTDNLEH